jgi:hypothetical protein
VSIKNSIDQNSNNFYTLQEKSLPISKISPSPSALREEGVDVCQDSPNAAPMPSQAIPNPLTSLLPPALSLPHLPFSSLPPPNQPPKNIHKTQAPKQPIIPMPPTLRMHIRMFRSRMMPMRYPILVYPLYWPCLLGLFV